MLLLASILFELSTLPFILENGKTPDKHLIETMPGGIAVFDYNKDGRSDIFFTNGAQLPTGKKFPNRLFRNDGGFKFTDVTKEAGLEGEGYSMGASAADFDNDGFVDLFVAGLRANRLYRNLGDGRFADVTSKSNLQSDEWGVAGGWVDFDGDGLLDLLVVNYGFIDLAKPRRCGGVYCNPRYYPARPNQLYRNRGDGVFESSNALAKFPGRGMSVAILDYDNDGKLDAFVTNDGLPNSLFHNIGGGKFEETALLSGVALLDHGQAVASMGVDVDRRDLAISALAGETFPLFRHNGKAAFTDQTAASQLGRLTNNYAGWAILFADFDNDGHRDLFTANSHVDDTNASYRQPNTVFRSLGNGKFENVDAGLSKAIKPHRGAAVADFDGDGRLDVVVSVIGEAAEVWRNVSEAGHSISVPVDRIGTTVTVDGVSRLFSPSAGYASSMHTPMHFGLGAKQKPEKVELHSPRVP